MSDDREFLQSVVCRVFDVGEEGLNVIIAFRLGKKADNLLVSPRPLKVVLESEEECRRVFARCHRLRGERYRIMRDLCLEDRIRMSQAVKELKERKEMGEEYLRIVDFRVVVRRPRVSWSPVVLLPCAPDPQLPAS